MTGDSGERAVDEHGQSLPEQIQAFAKWIAAGRKLTQTGRLTLGDARVLVPLLGTGDRIDPVIGDRMFRTPSSQELVRLNLLFEWSKAARLTRVAGGRLVPVKKNAGLLGDSAALRTALFEAFPRMPADAVVPSRWITSLVLEALPEACAQLRFQLGLGDGADLGTLQSAVWADLVPRFVLDHLDAVQLARLRETTDRDVAHVLALWTELGAVEHTKGRIRINEAVPATLLAAYGGAAADEQLFQLRVVLEDTDPVVWRRVLVPSSIRMDQLHVVLQAALGWTDSHLHLFTVGETRYGWNDPEFGEETIPEHTVRLADITAPGTVIGYEYDFGDGWEHTVLIEAATAQEPGMPYPRCVDGAAACPPEDCGGPWGYRDLRETLADPSAEDHQEMLHWLGINDAQEFDATAFDVVVADRRVASDWVARGNG